MIKNYIYSIENKYSKYMGYIYAIISYLLYTLYNNMIGASKGIPSIQVSSSRALCSLTSIYIINRRNKTPLYYQNPKYNLSLIVRGLISVINALFFYYGFQHIHLSEAIVIFQINPAIIGILSFFFLSEPYDIYLLFFTLFSFAGVILIMKPPMLFPNFYKEQGNSSTNGNFVGYMCLLTSAFTFSAIVVMARQQATQRITANTGLFYAFLFESLFLPLFQNFQGVTAISWEQAFTLVLLFSFGFIGNFILARAFVFDHAGKIALVGYSQILFGYIIDVVFLGIEPEFYSVIGSILIFCCFFIQLLQLRKQESSKLNTKAMIEENQ